MFDIQTADLLFVYNVATLNIWGQKAESTPDITFANGRFIKRNFYVAVKLSIVYGLDEWG